MVFWRGGRRGSKEEGLNRPTGGDLVGLDGSNERRG